VAVALLLNRKVGAYPLKRIIFFLIPIYNDLSLQFNFICFWLFGCALPCPALPYYLW